MKQASFNFPQNAGNGISDLKLYFQNFLGEQAQDPPRNPHLQRAESTPIGEQYWDTCNFGSIQND